MLINFVNKMPQIVKTRNKDSTIYYFVFPNLKKGLNTQNKTGFTFQYIKPDLKIFNTVRKFSKSTFLPIKSKCFSIANTLS